MKIGFVCSGWAPDPGGIESHTEDLARRLIESGHAVSALCLDGAGELEPYTTIDRERDGVRVRRMAYRYHDHRQLEDVIQNSRSEEIVRGWIADERPDVVHVHHLTGWGAGVLRVLSEKGLPSVMTLHDYWMLCPRGQMLHVDGAVCEDLGAQRCGACLARTWPHLFDGADAREHEQLARARTRLALDALSLPDRLLVPSRASLEVFARCGVARGRLSVCENGIETDELAREVSRLRASRSRPSKRELHLGVLGSVLPSKGALELARAFQEADVDDAVLDIHGPLPSYHGDTRYVDALRALAASDARIRLHGPYDRRDLGAILAGLDAVAAPSRWNEVFGLTVREAAAAGLPVLASDRGGLAAASRSNGNVTILPAEDREAWIAALRELFARLRCSHFRTPSRSRTASDMARELMSIYADVLRQRRNAV